jgi:hypothetical protein
MLYLLSHLIILSLFITADFLIIHLQSQILFREDFSTFENWDTFYFSGNKKKTDYNLKSDRDITYLQATSQSAASGLIFREEFNPNEYPVLEWRWKVDKIIEDADGKNKEGDDYPLRIFVMFDDDSVDISFWESIRNSAVKLLYGFEPPESSLCIVWANIVYNEEYFNSPYTENVKIIPLNMGNSHLSEWIVHKVNVPSLYNKIFRRSCPLRASLAIMSDSDNTGANVVGCVDYIEIRID